MDDKRITKITPEQEAAFPGIRDTWLKAGLSTEPADWETADRGVCAAYVTAGLDPPKFIIHLASPWQGVIGQAVAPSAITRAEVIERVCRQVRDQAYGQVDEAVREQAEQAVRSQSADQVLAQVGKSGDSLVGDQVIRQVVNKVVAQVTDRLISQVYRQVYDQVDVRVRARAAQADVQQEPVIRPVFDQVRDEVIRQVRGQVADRVVDQAEMRASGDPWDQVRSRVSGFVVRSVMDEAREHDRQAEQAKQAEQSVYSEIVTQTVAVIGRALSGEPDMGEVHTLLDENYDDRVRPELLRQTSDQVRAELLQRVYSRVYQQVFDLAVDEVPGAAARQEKETRDRMRNWTRARIGGQQWADYYAHYYALGTLGVKECDRLAGQMLVALSAGWWWCFKDFAVITDRPEVLERDANGDLHCETGMAVRYRDGWGFYSWHGRRVPEWVVMSPSAKRIAEEPNTEVRRCAIESMGWDKFISQGDLAQIGREEDPGNPGAYLVLYEVPPNLWGSRVRLLMCTNGSPERDGVRRRYGLTVPANIDDPVEAAAWTAGVSKEMYAGMVRRT